jgi:hypothetical protein
MYIDGSNGTVCIVNYANASNARTDPYGNLDDVYLHSSLEYLQFRETITSNSVSFSAVSRAYYTWADSGGKGGGCFITTACTEFMGLDDYCHELVTLRRFRDKHMFTSFDRVKQVMWYYENAPKIVTKLKARDDAEDVFTTMYHDYILPSVEAVDAGEMDKAAAIYETGVRYAAEKAGVSLG